MSVGLSSHELEELFKSLLYGLQNVCFELLELVLYGDKVLSIVVLFENLFVEAVTDTSLDQVRISVGIDTSTARVECRGVLTEELDMLLRFVAGFVDSFGALVGAAAQLLVLVFDLLMQTFKDGEDAPGQVFLGFQMEIGNALCRSVCALSLAFTRALRTCVLLLMFSNNPATPPNAC